MGIYWAFKPLAETNGATGFVEIDDKIGDKLLKDGDLQDPRIGATHLKTIETDGEYQTKVMTPKRRRKVSEENDK